MRPCKHVYMLTRVGFSFRRRITSSLCFLEAGGRARMKAQNRTSSKILIVLLFALLVTAAASSCGGPQAGARAKTYPVAGVAVESPAHYDSWPRDYDCWIPGEPGAVIMYGDTVKNGAGGGLIALLSVGGTLRAGEMAEFQIDKSGVAPPVVLIERGDLWLQDAGTVTARTSSAIIAPVEPKGANEESLCGIEVIPGGATTVTALNGQVKVQAAGASLTLQEGMSTTCEQGKAPSQAVEAEAQAPRGGYSNIIGLMEVPYFRNEATRSQTEDDAKAKLLVDPNDAWANVNLGRALVDAGHTAEAKEKFAHALEVNKGFSQALAGLGLVALDEGKWSEAVKLYEQARMADKTSLEARLGSAHAALGMGELGEAEKWYKSTLDLDSQSQLALAGLGIVNLLRGEKSKASNDLAEALKVQQYQAAALVFRSYMYALNGKLSSSLTSLKKASEARPDDFVIRADVADRYLRMGQNEAAASAFKRLSDSKDPTVMSSGYQGSGAVALLGGDLRNALADWTKAQDLSPDRAAVLEDLGQVDLLLDETEAAIAALSRAVAVDMSDWRAHEMLARALLARGSNPEAVTEGQAAVKLAPDEWSAHIVLGLALEACGAKDQAAVELSRGIALKPKSGLSAADHALFAEALQIQGKVPEALAEYKLAQEANPKDGSYYRLAGDMLSELGRDSDALAQYRKAAEMDRTDTLSQVKLAEGLYETGKKEDAIEVLQDSVERNPNDPLPRRLLGEYLLADDDVDGALFQLDAAIATTPIQPALLASALITRGNAKDRQEDFAGAIADYSRAISSDPARGDAWFYLAGDLERMGKPAEAKAAYANAAAICKDKPEWKKFYDEATTKMSQLG